jgi:hypothetical protein
MTIGICCRADSKKKDVMGFNFLFNIQFHYPIVPIYMSGVSRVKRKKRV